ncbi:MerR family transcriptional regulator [Sporolactobacillus sp. CPB3-1]|uniref:MerR family transcriptional regulator n=1 Tax=Sporolactobacillus mangiferae TaxID=2940498 RepID=A0ABT0M9P5_9BACL|nr:MerR family transcriptional regulator [Sporolactobacillus mangiferae]MCL1631593.1 MerR family transcriptional regulator [Sporolactobacillus mangiferae]
MKISELSKRTGVSARSLRYYEEKELLHSARTDNGYRDYDESTVDQVRTIQLYFSLGLNSDQISQVVNCDPIVFPYDKLVCSEVIEVYKEKISEVSQQIEELKAIQSRLEERMVLTLRSLEAEKEKHQLAIRDEGQC